MQMLQPVESFLLLALLTPALDQRVCCCCFHQQVISIVIRQENVARFLLGSSAA